MTYIPHLRVSMLGDLPGGEQFSCSLSMANVSDNAAWLTNLMNIGPNDDVYDDIADTCAAWFGRDTSGISTYAVLKRVKIAPISATGEYAGVAVEKSRVVAGGYAPNGSQGLRPNQTALAVTLHTAGDLGRVKGRFYSPLPQMPLEADGRLLASRAETVRDSAQTLVNGLNNQPGVDVLDLVVVVASQGRRDKNGNVKIGPKNHKVTGVSVGWTLDTIRRRRNKQGEGPRPQASVS